MAPSQALLNSMATINFVLRGEYIPLDALLKATGLAPSGGLAKAFVAQGQVEVDGALELRKTCKIRSGQVVTMGDVRVQVSAAPNATAAEVE
jgi:ribosome-associated protein